MAKDVISAARANALKNTHGGPALLLTADYGQTFPTKIDDVIDFTPGGTQFAPKTGWTSIGITKSGINISRGFDKVDREADQSYGVYDFRPTKWTTTLSTELLETSLAALKLAWAGGPAVINQAGVVTPLTAPTSAAGTTFTVVGVGASYVTGDVIIVGLGSSQEWLLVVSSTATSITTGACTYAHAIGEPIRKLTKESITFGTRRLIDPKLLAVVAPLQLEDASLGGTVAGMRMWAVRRAKLESGQRQMALSNGADWSLPISFAAMPDLTIADPDMDTLTVFDFSTT